MSVFLGPIHYWLYNKIRLQDELTGVILKDQEKLSASLDQLCESVETRPLEEAIDTGNIHGWLQQQVTIAERRFAFAVTGLLKEGRKLTELEALALNFGQSHPVQAKTAVEVYKGLQNILLDGMPCDHVNQLRKQNEEQVEWEQVIDLHSSYWEEAGGKGETYYALRTAMVKGMLEGTSFYFERKDTLFTIRKG